MKNLDLLYYQTLSSKQQHEILDIAKQVPLTINQVSGLYSKLGSAIAVKQYLNEKYGYVFFTSTEVTGFNG